MSPPPSEVTPRRRPHRILPYIRRVSKDMLRPITCIIMARHTTTACNTQQAHLRLPLLATTVSTALLTINRVISTTLRWWEPMVKLMVLTTTKVSMALTSIRMTGRNMRKHSILVPMSGNLDRKIFL